MIRSSIPEPECRPPEAPFRSAQRSLQGDHRDSEGLADFLLGVCVPGAHTVSGVSDLDLCCLDRRPGRRRAAGMLAGLHRSLDRGAAKGLSLGCAPMSTPAGWPTSARCARRAQQVPVPVSRRSAPLRPARGTPGARPVRPGTRPGPRRVHLARGWHGLGAPVGHLPGTRDLRPLAARCPLPRRPRAAHRQDPSRTADRARRPRVHQRPGRPYGRDDISRAHGGSPLLAGQPGS
jgi:hypothetical protein